MDFLKRLFFYMVIILLCISVYIDITEGTLPRQPEEVKKEEEKSDLDNATIIKVKVKPGDTVLSITEQINAFSNNHMNIQQILADFKQNNPNADPNNLDINESYYFLHYDDV